MMFGAMAFCLSRDPASQLVLNPALHFMTVVRWTHAEIHWSIVSTPVISLLEFGHKRDLSNRRP
jgi:hypothetical protein